MNNNKEIIKKFEEKYKFNLNHIAGWDYSDIFDCVKWTIEETRLATLEEVEELMKEYLPNDEVLAFYVEFEKLKVQLTQEKKE